MIIDDCTDEDDCTCRKCEAMRTIQGTARTINPMVEHVLSLADLYRKGRAEGLLQARSEYT